MRKLIAAINVTLDGFCDHTAVIADAELHANVNELFETADLSLFGRVTYQLMESSWPAVVTKPTGVAPVDKFAVLIDNIPKLVFSHTLKTVHWKNATLATGNLIEEVRKIKKQTGKNIIVGSPSIIVSLLQAGLVDECRFSVQPIVLGKGLFLFKGIKERIDFTLVQSKVLQSGVVVQTYQTNSSNEK